MNNKPILQNVPKRKNSAPEGYSEFNLKDNLPDLGQKKRLKTMKRRLSIGFSMTSKEKLDTGMLKYAKNRNSKGKLVPIFWTLTYPDNDHWEPTDITDFCRKISQYAKRHWDLKLRYFWVAETTKNGTIHYHLTAWIPRNKRFPKASEPIIYNNRNYGVLWKYRSKIEAVKKGVYSYMLKYISKGCNINGLGIEKELFYEDDNPILDSRGRHKTAKPRLFGYGGFDRQQRELMTYSMLPSYVRKYFDSVSYGDLVQRIKGGWQVKRASIVSKKYKYYQYCYDTLKTNYELWFEDFNGHKVIGYDYGINWSSVPDRNTNPIFYPF